MTPTTRPSARQRGYNTRWERYRKEYLKAHPLCVVCPKYGQSAASTTVDHIKDHKGDQRLFWDPKNHQALCTRCHSIKTARTTGAPYLQIPLCIRGKNRGCDVEGNPINPEHHWQQSR